MELRGRPLSAVERIIDLETIKTESGEQRQRGGNVEYQFSAEEKRRKKEMVQQKQEQIGQNLQKNLQNTVD